MSAPPPAKTKNPRKAVRRIADLREQTNIGSRVVVRLMRQLGLNDKRELAVRLAMCEDRFRSLDGRTAFRGIDAYRVCLATQADLKGLLVGEVNLARHPAQTRRPDELRKMREALGRTVAEVFAELTAETHDCHTALLFADLMLAIARFHAAIRAPTADNHRRVNATQAWQGHGRPPSPLPGWAVALEKALRCEGGFDAEPILAEVRREFIAKRK